MAYNNMKKEEYAQSPEYGWKPGPSAAPTSPSSTGAGSSRNVLIDPESLEPKNMDFSDETIRKGFIRKVYLILMVQLLITFGFVALFLFHRGTQQLFESNPSLIIGAFIVTLVLIIAMSCCETARRSFPTNFICLFVFTLAESFLVGAIASTYKADSVLLAVGITAFLCLALTIFAMQTKYDFTACGGILLAALLCLLIFGIVAMFWRDHIVQTIYGVCGALLSCIFLIFDTQLMMGGSHKYSISPEEYIFAALNLYMDVIRIFLYILQLMGSKK